jgi:hypothetical protein
MHFATLMIGVSGALPQAAFAGSARISEALIGGLTVQNLEIDSASLDSRALEARFAEPDDTAAFLALEAETVRFSRVYTTPIYEGEPPRHELGAGQMTGLRAGIAKSFEAATMALRFDYAALPVTFQMVKATDLGLSSLLPRLLPDVQNTANPLALSYSAIEASAIIVPPLSIGTEPITNEIRIGGFKSVRETADNAPRRLALTLQSIEAWFLPKPGSVEVALTYDAAKSALSLETARFFAPEFGTIGLTAQLDGVTPQAIAGNESDMLGAWLGARATRVAVTLDDNGMMNEVFGAIAERRGIDIASARLEASEISRIAVNALLADNPQTASIGTALAEFISSSGSLAMAADARAGGLGFADFIAAERATDLLPQIELSASAKPR